MIDWKSGSLGGTPMGMRFGAAVLLACGVTLAGLGDALRPWEQSALSFREGTVVQRPDLLDLEWRALGPEGRAKVTDGPDGRMLVWTIGIDHHNASDYPVGWPNCETRPAVPVDFGGRTLLAFRMRATRDIGRSQIVHFILRNGSETINMALPAFTDTEWRKVIIPLGRPDRFRTVDKIHFFIDESQYRHGDALEFQIRDFRLAEAAWKRIPLAAGNAGATLWLGDRADADSRVVMLRAPTNALAAVLHVENRLGRDLPATAEARFRLRDVFTGKDAVRTLPLAETVPDGARKRLAFTLDLSGLMPSYYHVLADIRVKGRSVLGIRKGSDDFYLAAADESETHAMLSLRTGMAGWVRDRLHGGFVHLTEIALPHAYDPYAADPAAYHAFVRQFMPLTAKICEGYEAGVTGLALAAEAFRRNGEKARLAFAEGLLWNACDAMLGMQDACGGVVSEVNELAGTATARNVSYNGDQIAEWMRGLSYASLYCLRRGGAEKRMRRLNDACRKAGAFVLANGLRDSDGIPGVIRHHRLIVRDGRVNCRPYEQEGVLCDVYQPRILAGLSYAALAFLKCGGRVPEEWWTAFDATVRWMDAKMKPNGWFDWQCSDRTEGGCHTFLGNIYAGEGLFGVYLAETAAGRQDSAAAALKAAHRAYRYVTDDCWVRGRRFECPIEFWTGPYVYWLFTEWNRHAGREPVFADWLATMDRRWREERRWGDFLRVTGMNCGRADTNGMLTVAILGYLGLREMEETGRPWSLFD